MLAAPLRDSLPDDGIVGENGSPDRNARRLLLVDDDADMARTLAYYFERRGFDVIRAATMAGAKAVFVSQPNWTLVIADYHLPDGTGWDLCCWIRQQTAVPPPFLMTSGAAGTRELAAKIDFLAKPFSVRQLENRVETMLASSAR